MDYNSSYHKMTDAFSTGETSFIVEDKIIESFKFSSTANSILPGLDQYRCVDHNLDFDCSFNFANKLLSMDESIDVKDALIAENNEFEYFIMRSHNDKPVKKVIFLLHGFNEKLWDKYYSWGHALCEKTGSAIVFFPLAFHMQRSKHEWNDRTSMYKLSAQRKLEFPNIVDSSLVNVAISIRLHNLPQRFIWSGLQTYYDILQLIDEFKAGKHLLIDKDFSFDFFAYSIGALVAEILKLSNYKGYFTESKIGLFCGGAVFNRIGAVSKFIIDSEASVALFSYLVEHLNNIIKKDDMMKHYLEEHTEGMILRSMLRFNRMREYREGLFKQVEDDFYAITLKGDMVIPPCEIINTLQGAYRNINIKVDEMDFCFPYTHEIPFPINTDHQNDVDKAFNNVFDKFGAFFNGN